MNRAIDLVLKLCVFVFLVSFALSLYLLISGSSSPIFWRNVGVAASILFTAIVTAEVLGSSYAKPATKTVWILSFLTFQIFAGLAYLLVDRKTINPVAKSI
jgi:hypothetical protein